MGIARFGSSYSSYDGYKIIRGNPNPHNFNILRYCQLRDKPYIVLLVSYPDAINYEGKKVLVYKDISIGEILKRKSLDPHFSENGLSPIARFEPTDNGYAMAIEFIRSL